MSDEIFRILHLSDLHFGDNSCWRDLRTDPKACGLKLVEYIEAGLEAGGLTADKARESGNSPYFELMVISGDLTNFGKENGMAAAEWFVDIIRGRRDGDGTPMARWWSAPEILLIPGNHDFDFGKRPQKLDELPRLLLSQPRAKRQEPFRKAYARICDEPHGGAEFLAVIKVVAHHRLTVLGFDSCRLESWQSPGVGFVGLDQLALVMSGAHEEEQYRADEGPTGVPWVRLAFVHHHLDGLESPDIQMGELMTKRYGTFCWDAKDLKAELSEQCVDVVLHGHLHQPKLYEEENAKQGSARILGAGSVGVAATEFERLHHFYTLEIGPSDGGTARSLTVGSFTHSATGDTNEPWNMTRPRTFSLTGADRQDPSALRPDAAYWNSFARAFEDWATAKLFLTEKGFPYKFAGLLQGLDEECRGIWNRLMGFESLPAWDKVMDRLLLEVEDKGRLMLKEFEQFLRGEKAMPFANFLIHFALRADWIKTI